MVKENQPELKEQLEKVMGMQSGGQADVTLDAGHGRIERRTCQATDRLTFLDDKEEWAGLKSIAKITPERNEQRAGYSSHQVSYSISSPEAQPVQTDRADRTKQ